jgi:hypothetical protein
LQEAEVSAREVPAIYNGVPDGCRNNLEDMRNRGRTLGGATGEGGCNLRSGRRRARMGVCEAAAEENGEADVIYWAV